MPGIADLTRIRDDARAVTAGFDVSTMTIDAAEQALALAVEVKNMFAAVESLAAAKVAASGIWRTDGEPSADVWLARRSGTSASRAREAIEVGRRLGRLGATAEAALAGRLSAEQAGLITDAATADPRAETRLINLAGRESLTELRSSCADVKAKADADPGATWRRLRDQRRLARWTDREGMYNLHLRTTVDDGAAIDRALAPLLDAGFTADRKAGKVHQSDHHAADTVVRLLTRRDSDAEGTGPTRVDPRYLTLVRVDLDALTRGQPADGERCEITGVGPIPVERARELLGESVLKIVLTKGSQVRGVAHAGRGPSAAQQLALLWRQPLCTAEGCGRRHGIEYDHRTPWAEVRTTDVENIDPLCGFHHDLKTYSDWALIDGSGRRSMVPPDDPRHPRASG